MGVPLHRLSCCIGSEDYLVSRYQEKQALLIVSPDPRPLREHVLDRIAQACPALTIRVIENLPYDDYRKLAGSAKWSLTFGEGLDGYFIEPVLSGGVSFAVFNDRHFTFLAAGDGLSVVGRSDGKDDGRSRPSRRARDVRALLAPELRLCSLYNTQRFRENLRTFYRGYYTFP